MLGQFGTLVYTLVPSIALRVRVVCVCRLPENVLPKFAWLALSYCTRGVLMVAILIMGQLYSCDVQCAELVLLEDSVCVCVYWSIKRRVEIWGEGGG